MKVSSLNKFKGAVVDIKLINPITGVPDACSGLVEDVEAEYITLNYGNGLEKIAISSILSILLQEKRNINQEIIQQINILGDMIKTVSGLKKTSEALKEGKKKVLEIEKKAREEKEKLFELDKRAEGIEKKGAG